MQAQTFVVFNDLKNATQRFKIAKKKVSVEVSSSARHLVVKGIVCLLWERFFREAGSRGCWHRGTIARTRPV